MGLTQTTAPTDYPVSLDEVKQHCNIIISDDDGWLTSAIAAATRQIERRLDRQLVVSTWTYSRDNFPVGLEIELPKPPLMSVTSLKYMDLSSTQQTFSSAYYTVDTTREPGRIVLNYGYTWPTCRGHIQDVSIVYKAGYGVAGCTEPASILAVPETFKLLIKSMVAVAYENREPVLIGDASSRINLLWDSIISSEEWEGYC